MSWKRETWVDDDGTLTVGTQFDAAHMNNIEDGIGEANKKALSIPVVCASTSALAAYTRSGNVITANSGGTILGLPGELDGIEPSSGQYLLLKNGAANADNGVYKVLSVGNLSTGKWSLERVSEMSASAQVIPSMEVWVERGTKNADRRYVLTTDGPITLNTTGLVFGLYSPKDYGLVSALPTASALVGDRCAYQADKTNGVIWEFIYDGETTLPWKKVGGARLLAASNIERSLENKTTYTSLPTDPLKITLPLKGDYDITIEARARSQAATRFGLLSYALGAFPAADEWSIQLYAGNTDISLDMSKTSRWTGLAAGIVIEEKGKTGGAYLFQWLNRRLWVDPIRVG